MIEEKWRINPKITQWIDMFMSWGMNTDKAQELVMNMWMKLPLDIRITDPEIDDLK